MHATERGFRAYMHTVTPPGSQNTFRVTISSTQDHVPSVPVILLSTHEQLCHLLSHSNPYIPIVMNCLNYQEGISTQNQDPEASHL